MVKHVADWTYQDMVEYRERRAQDGNWSIYTALVFCDCAHKEPVFFWNRRKRLERWWQKCKNQVVNTETNPLVDIETGNVLNEE